MVGPGPGPDGMGMDTHRERENMREAAQTTHTPPWELAALDADGNELYRTEYYETRQQAEAAAEGLNEEDVAVDVDHFEVVPAE